MALYGGLCVGISALQRVLAKEWQHLASHPSKHEVNADISQILMYISPALQGVRVGLHPFLALLRGGFLLLESALVTCSVQKNMLQAYVCEGLCSP